MLELITLIGQIEERKRVISKRKLSRFFMNINKCMEVAEYQMR